MEWFALKSSEAKFAQENIFNYLMDIIRKKNEQAFRHTSPFKLKRETAKFKLSIAWEQLL